MMNLDVFVYDLIVCIRMGKRGLRNLISFALIHNDDDNDDTIKCMFSLVPVIGFVLLRQVSNLLVCSFWIPIYHINTSDLSISCIPFSSSFSSLSFSYLYFTRRIMVEGMFFV